MQLLQVSTHDQGIHLHQNYSSLVQSYGTLSGPVSPISDKLLIKKMRHWPNKGIVFGFAQKKQLSRSENCTGPSAKMYRTPVYWTPWKKQNMINHHRILTHQEKSKAKFQDLVLKFECSNMYRISEYWSSSFQTWGSTLFSQWRLKWNQIFSRQSKMSKI